MQPCSREMQSMNLSLLNQNQQVSLHDLHHFDTTSPAVAGGSSAGEDFLDQIFSTNSWPPPLDPNSHLSAAVKPPQSPWDPVGSMEDQSSFLASKLRQHQIGGAKALILQQQLMLSRGLAAATAGNGLRSPGSGGANGLLPLPLNLSGNGDQNDVMLDGPSFKSANSGNEVASVQALFNGFNGGSLGQTSSQTPHFHHPQNFNAPAMNQVAAASGSTAAGVGGGAAPAGQPRQQRVRARRGQATDPHSIAERLRRERIAERMKALQELVPNANKTDKASMLDEIIDYVKFLQLQVKVLSMSRLGGAAAVAPLVADMSSEGGNERGNNGTQTASSSDSMTVTEHQVAKLMEEDMGSAMQYLQGKGLCLMPISLATAISTATCHSRNPMIPGRSGPTSPSMSGLTVQSATVVNGGGAEPSSVKDAVSVSKP